ncbi:MAG: hypothetical protein LBM60_06325 [Clostridium sp.]|jgi:hypothetical protein|nr:hypothetical protein [Clostridium sp.]
MKKISVLALAFLLTLSLVACGNKDTEKPNSGNNTPPPSSQSGNDTPTPSSQSGNTNNPSGIIDIPHEDISMIGLDDDKEAILAEIPAEFLKGVGESGFSQISNIGVLEGYKYSLLINLTTAEDQGPAELEKLMDYYRSIGGTVTDATYAFDDYDIKFDYAESTSCTAMSSSIVLSFSIVKGVLTGENDEALVSPDGQAWLDEYDSGYIFNADGTFSYYAFGMVSFEGTWYTSGTTLNMTDDSPSTYSVSGDTLTLVDYFGDAYDYTLKTIPSND